MENFAASVPVSALGVYCARSTFWSAITGGTFVDDGVERDAHAIAVAASNPALDADTIRAGARGLRSSAKLNRRLIATVTGGPTKSALEQIEEKCAVMEAIASQLDAMAEEREAEVRAAVSSAVKIEA